LTKVPISTCRLRTAEKEGVTPRTGTFREREPDRTSAVPKTTGATPWNRYPLFSRMRESESVSLCLAAPMMGGPPLVSIFPGVTIRMLLPSPANWFST
jgi:hypothetical protein